MSKARDRADRKGVDPVNIGNARLSLDSAGTSDLKVTAQDGTTLKKVFAEQIQLGTGKDALKKLQLVMHLNFKLLMVQRQRQPV